MKGNFDALINSENLTLVDFHAVWCQPCKVQSPILQEVARELGNKVRIIKIDVDKNPAVAARFQIQGVPTLALFKSGKLVWRQSGVTPGHVLREVINTNQ
jgi:thioredoxin 1